MRRCLSLTLAVATAGCSQQAPKSVELRSDHFEVQANQKYAGPTATALAYFAEERPEVRDELVIFLMGPEAYYRYNSKIRRFDYLENYRNNANTSEVNGNVHYISSLTRLPFVFLALPGAFGSQGSRHDQHASQAVQAVNDAIEELKRIYSSQSVSIAAQSSATAIAASLPALRSDIRCLALSSGVYDWPAIVEANGWPTTYAGTKEPLAALAAVPQYRVDPERRIVMLADPHDRRVSFGQSERFHDAVLAAGHRVELLQVESTIDLKDHHNLQTEAVLTLADCIRDS